MRGILFVIYKTIHHYHHIISHHHIIAELTGNQHTRFRNYLGATVYQHKYTFNPLSGQDSYAAKNSYAAYTRPRIHTRHFNRRIQTAQTETLNAMSANATVPYDYCYWESYDPERPTILTMALVLGTGNSIVIVRSHGDASQCNVRRSATRGVENLPPDIDDYLLKYSESIADEVPGEYAVVPRMATATYRKLLGSSLVPAAESAVVESPQMVPGFVVVIAADRKLYTGIITGNCC